MKKVVSLFFAVVLLSGCATNYTFEGARYEGSEAFQRAVDQHVSATLAQVTPLPKPLTNKRLIVAIPSEATILTENIKRTAALNGRQPTGVQLELIENLSKSTHKTTVVAYDAIKKRGVFPGVIVNETATPVNSIEPSKDYDVMYYTEATPGSGQLFYSSVKHGRQVFPWDRSGANMSAKISAFIESVQALAIRD